MTAPQVTGDIVLPENPTVEPKANPYLKIVDNQDAQDKQNLAQSAFVAGQRADPARWAKVVELSQRLKVSPHFADQNFDVLSKQDEQSGIIAKTQGSPGLARWLQDPDNATIGKAELPALAKIDQHVRALSGLTDTLFSVIGGRPAIAYATPPTSDAQGEYVGPNYRNRTADTVYLNPDPTAHLAPDDFVVSHEIAHRLFSQNDLSAPPAYRPKGATDPAIATIISSIKARKGETAPTEEFARAFSEALATVRGTRPNVPKGMEANPTDVKALHSWLLTRPEYKSQAQTAALGEPQTFLGNTPWKAQQVATLQSGVRQVEHAIKTGYSDMKAAVGNLALAYGHSTPEEAAQFVADANKNSANLRAIEPAYAKEAQAAMAPASRALDVNLAATKRDVAQKIQRGQILDALKRFGSGNVQTVGDLLGMLSAAITHPRGTAYSIAESAPALAPILAGGAIGGLGGPVGAGAGTFIGMAPLNVGNEINAELQKRGYDITDKASLLKAYSDPSLMADIRAKAARAGVTSAAVSSLVMGYAGRLTAAAKAAGEGVVKTAAATAGDIGIQAGGQGVAQVAGQAAGAKGDLGKVSVAQGVETAISMLGYGIGETVLGASQRGVFHPDPVVAAADVTSHAAEALSTLHEAQALEQIGQAIKEAPVTASLPDRVKQLVETAAGGEDASTVYFKPEEFDAYFQSKGESPAKAASDIMGDDGKAYYEAKSTGAPLAIPLGDYVSKVGPTDHFEGLLQSARMRPGGTTLGEAQDYLKSLPATMADLAKEAQTSEPAPATSIRDAIAQRLESVGRSKSEAQSAGQVYEQAFSTLGKRSGIDPQLLFDQYNLKIQRGDVPIMPGEMAQSPRTGERRGIDAENKAARAAFDEVAQAIKDFPEERRQALLEAMRNPEFQQGEQGRFRINPQSRQAIIDLFKPADRSTFLHETGHFYLEVLGDLATGEKASPEITKDYNSILTWLGVENKFQIGIKEHEQFARGFEAYLMEGKAPTPALRDAFYRFKRWLVGLYKNVESLNVNLSPEIRSVFDRMLATDEEIARATTEQHTEPLFDNPQALGLSEDQAAKYSKDVQDSNQAAEEEVTQRLMKEVRREEGSEWKAQKAEIRTAVESEANADPTQKALALLTRGKSPNGEALPEGTQPFKLSKNAIVEDFGKDRLAELPKPFVYSVEGGVHPDAAAEALGFKSGDELLKALASSEKYGAYVDRVTNERMQATHGERLSEIQLREIAAQAVRNEKQVQVQRQEAKILYSEHFATAKGMLKKVVGSIPPLEETRAQAQKIIGSKSVREIRPDLYKLAASRHATDAREKFFKGDWQGAFDSKLKEILATEIWKAAQDAKNGVTDGLQEFKKVFQSDTKLAKTRDMDLINAARSILSEFGIGTSKGTPDSFLSQIKQYDPEMAQVVEQIVSDATQEAQNYKTMPYEDFAFLRESIKGLWNMSRQVMTTTVDGVKVDRRIARDELVTRAESLRAPGELIGYKQAVTGWEKAKIGLLAFKAVSRRIEHWVRGFDGGDSQGVMRKYVWNRISEAATQFRVEKKAALTEYAEFIKGLRNDMPISRAKIPSPELDYAFAGHNELLGALLHSGNESNLAKLLVGRGWGKILEDGTLDTSRWDSFTKRLRSEGVLTKAHYDYVQGVWDRFEGLKPGAQRAHKEQFGRYFSEITQKEFANEYGNYKGGYYPAKVDPYMVSDAQAKADKDALLGSNTSFMYPSVGRGFTKERVENYRRPLMLDASAVPQHFDAVLRFTHLGPAVRDVARIVMDPVFRQSIDALDPTIMGDAIVPWLSRAGQQRGETQGDTGKFWATANKVAGKVRNNSALQIMAFNSTVLLEQLTHFPSVFVRVDKGKMANAVWKYATDHKAMTEAINDRSPFMATRETAALTEARKQIDRILLDPSVFEKVQDFSQAHGRFLMAGVQSVMDHVTWHAAYDQALETMDETEAARHADSMVRELLGSYNPEDVSKIESGTPIQRLFTMFYGFFNTKGNVLATEGTIAKQVGLKKSAGRATGALFWGFMIPAFMGTLIKTAMSNQPFVEDDEGTGTALLRHFGLSQIEMAARMVPYASNVLAVGEAAFGHGKSDSLLDSPAIKELGDAFGGTLKDLHDLQGGEELSSKMITDFFTLIGMSTGLPVRPLAKPIGYYHDVKAGNVEPASPADFGRGLLVGH